MKTGAVLLLIALIFACRTNPDQEKFDYEEGFVKYAEKFKISKQGITVTEPWPGAVSAQNHSLNRVPQRIVVTSTTHLPYLEILGELDHLVAFPNTQYIFSPEIRKRVESGQIVDLGPDGQINLELLFDVSPDLVVAFDMGQESTQLDKIVEAGIPVVYNADFLETSTLGRAEWIKFFGELLGQRSKADSIFTEIEHTYLSLKKLATLTTTKPSVFSGVMYGDTWFLPGGCNWAAQFIQDAGGAYIWSDNSSNGWLEVSFETVLNRCQDAEFWIGTSTFTSMESLQDADERYRLFEAFENDKIYSFHRQRSAAGGFDYFESGYARPDRILADYIAILHPELLPDYEMYYFARLE